MEGNKDVIRKLGAQLNQRHSPSPNDRQQWRAGSRAIGPLSAALYRLEGEKKRAFHRAIAKIISNTKVDQASVLWKMPSETKPFAIEAGEPGRGYLFGPRKTSLSCLKGVVERESASASFSLIAE
ncbi:hypothetical protein FRB99_000354 [Tulasnella sp. 403]|nr:hypothetical protein FRB99_000354 [Tulasnella sp. 403]